MAIPNGYLWLSDLDAGGVWWTAHVLRLEVRLAARGFWSRERLRSPTTDPLLDGTRAAVGRTWLLVSLDTLIGCCELVRVLRLAARGFRSR
ncbi:hypothetical protein quinque_002395 [Culex quinquefasciatus]